SDRFTFYISKVKIERLDDLLLLDFCHTVPEQPRQGKKGDLSMPWSFSRYLAFLFVWLMGISTFFKRCFFRCIACHGILMIVDGICIDTILGIAITFICIHF